MSASLPTAPPPTQARIAYCLIDADGYIAAESAAPSAAEPFYAASTIKLHVALAAVRAAARGDLDLDAQIPASRETPGRHGRPVVLDGDHLTADEPADGTPLTIAELVRRAISISSNTATNQLISRVGLDAIAAVIEDLRLESTRVERMIGDVVALEEGCTNETTARDLARTVRTILTEPGDGGALIRDALRHQSIPIILTALAPGAVGGSKSGWVDGYRHDVAFVHADVEDPRRARVLAVMTAGLEEADADERILALARKLLGDLAR